MNRRDRVGEALGTESPQEAYSRVLSKGPNSAKLCKGHAPWVRGGAE